MLSGVLTACAMLSLHSTLRPPLVPLQRFAAFSSRTVATRATAAGPKPPKPPLPKPTTPKPDGFILASKPKGWTSFDVVGRVRGDRGGQRHACGGELAGRARDAEDALDGAATEDEESSDEDSSSESMRRTSLPAPGTACLLSSCTTDRTFLLRATASPR